MYMELPSIGKFVYQDGKEAIVIKHFIDSNDRFLVDVVFDWDWEIPAFGQNYCHRYEIWAIEDLR